MRTLHKSHKTQGLTAKKHRYCENCNACSKVTNNNQRPYLETIVIVL